MMEIQTKEEILYKCISNLNGEQIIWPTDALDAMQVWADQEVDLSQAADPRLEEHDMQQQEVWVKFIKDWKPRETNSVLGEAIENKVNDEKKKVLEDFRAFVNLYNEEKKQREIKLRQIRETLGQVIRKFENGGGFALSEAQQILDLLKNIK